MKMCINLTVRMPKSLPVASRHPSGEKLIAPTELPSPEICPSFVNFGLEAGIDQIL